MSIKPLGLLVLGAETVAGAYVAFIVGLMCAWMVDDDQAFRMRSMDWAVQGCRRLGIALIVSAAFTFVARLAHRQWVTPGGTPAWVRGVPLLLGGCIALAGVAGATFFIVSKPFI